LTTIKRRFTLYGMENVVALLKQLFRTKTKNKLLKIGALAKETKETIHTLRFWVKEGLLTVKSYTKGGYQLFDAKMIKTIKTIRRLQTKHRLTIAEIKQKLNRLF
jgi:predicted methyltransferase